MKRALLILTLISLAGLAVSAQKDIAAKPEPAPALIASTAKTAAASPDDIAKAAVLAHGGDKLRQLKTLVIKGSVDMNVSNQIMPGAFSSAVSGDKYFFEITSPMQSFKQISDGQQTFSSMPGIMLPPLNSVGFGVLGHVGDEGYVVQAFAEGKKKGRGFRVVSPDGFYTDFITDEKTGQVKGFESAFELSGGRVITTSAAIDELQNADGVLVPKKYSQRFDFGAFTAYASFKAKEVLVNPQMADNAFAIPIR